MTKSAKDKDSYAAKLKEFEELVAWFESGDVDLAEAVDKFEAASKLAKQLKTRLNDVDNSINKIKQNFDQQ